MKLYELPRGSYFKIVGDDQLYYFVKIDGAYSYCVECKDDGSTYENKVVHFGASTEVILC